MQSARRSSEYKFCGWSTSARATPAPVFVEADDAFDGLEKGDDCGGPEANGGPLVDDGGNVLRTRIYLCEACVYGDDPDAAKHQNVDDGECGRVENDGGHVAKADPIGASEVDACANDCGEHDEDSRQINAVQDRRKSD